MTKSGGGQFALASPLQILKDESPAPRDIRPWTVPYDAYRIVSVSQHSNNIWCQTGAVRPQWTIPGGQLSIGSGDTISHDQLVIRIQFYDALPWLMQVTAVAYR